MRTAWVAAILVLPPVLAVSAPHSESSSHSGGSSETAASSGSDSGSAGGHTEAGGSTTTTSSSGSAHSGSSGVHPGAPNSPATLGSRQPSGAIPRTPMRSRAGEPNLPVGSRFNQSDRGARADQPRISRPTSLLHERSSNKDNTLTTRDGRTHQGNWSRNDPANRGRFGRQTQERLRNWQGRRSSFAEACRRHNDHHRHHHDRDWWRQHCPVLVLVDWGFWGWDDGWWYPAWGYDTNYSYYEYDGPIYGYDGLLPDEIIANVQAELQRLGYYPYEVDGIFGPLTQEALARFQSDHGIPITGAIDPETLSVLGLL